MQEVALQGRCILIVEDEYLLADDLSTAVADAGAEVCGPFGSIGSAADALDRAGHIDCALLDVNLDGEMVFALADALLGRGIPFAFTTGYDRAALPDRFGSVPRIEKPTRPSIVVNVLGSLAQHAH